MKAIKTFGLLVTLSLLFFLGACAEQETQTPEGNQEVEEQVEDAGEEVEEGVEEVEEGVEEAGEELEN